jgi:predicted amidohydrolase YtcJ
LRLKLWLQYTELARVLPHAGTLASRRVGGCLAWEMDGSVSSRSAAFDEPYLDGGGDGHLYRSPAEAFELVAPFVRSGWQTSAHAIGPRGIESILSAYERLLGEAADPANARRLRIDHFEFPRPDQIERAGRLRLVLPVQPGFAWADDLLIHSYDEALSSGIRARQSPLRSLVDAGCVVALSTDAPVQSLDPFIQVAGAVCHPVAAERISVHEALRAYSWAGAYAAFEEDERGSLAPGKYADFAVLDRDPFTTPPGELHEIRVLATWHEGRPLAAPPPGLAGFALRAITAKRRQL